MYLAIALLFWFSAVNCSDFEVCLRRIALDSNWDYPEAVVYVNGVSQLTSAWQSNSGEIVYGDNDYCVDVNEGDSYEVALKNNGYVSYSDVCDSSDTINAAFDLGLTETGCYDDNGGSNYFDFYVSAISTFSVTIENVDYISGEGSFATFSSSLSDCKTSCEARSSCNYLSFDGTMCTMFTSHVSVEVNEDVTSVSYMCYVYDVDESWLTSGSCSSAGNRAECGWDGGDCCMASNSELQVTNDALCEDPRYQGTTITTTASPVDEPTTTTTDTTTTAADTTTTSAPDTENADPLCQQILDNVDGFPFSWVGDGTCDTANSNGVSSYSYYLNGNGGSTTVNDEICNWEGGDCCTATNAELSTDDNCVDPRYQTAITTTTTLAPSPSATSVIARPTSKSSNNKNENDANARKSFIVLIVVMISALYY